MVSHDRDFLNYVCTDIIYLHRQKLEYFKGDYDAFEKVVYQNKKLKAKKHKQTLKDIAKIRQTKDAKVKRDLKKKLANNGGDVKLEKEYSVKFDFPNPTPLGIPIIQIKDASFGYKKDEILFEKVSIPTI